jgi:hypothetical protein
LKLMPRPFVGATATLGRAHPERSSGDRLHPLGALVLSRGLLRGRLDGSWLRGRRNRPRASGLWGFCRRRLAPAAAERDGHREHPSAPGQHGGGVSSRGRHPVKVRAPAFREVRKTPSEIEAAKLKTALR